MEQRCRRCLEEELTIRGIAQLRELLHEFFACEYDGLHVLVERHVRGGYAAEIAPDVEGGGGMGAVERQIMIDNLSDFWTAHINRMRFTRKSCMARSFGGLNALEEYTLASSRSFTRHLQSMRRRAVTELWRTLWEARRRCYWIAGAAGSPRM